MSAAPNVLVTGGTGFLGSRLAGELLRAGQRVRVLARPTSDLWRLDGLDIEIVRGDVLQAQTLPAAMDGTEVVYHLAGMLGGEPVPDAAYRELHVDGTQRVLSAAHQAGVRRVVHLSSPGVLGPIENPPAGEDSPHAPSNIYEATKSEAEQMALAYARQTGLSLTVVRPEFVYGPGDTHVLGLFRTINKGAFFYIGSGTNLVHPTYVDDAVQGMIRCQERGEAGRVYHIAGPEPVTILHLAETIAAELGCARPWLRVPKFLATIGALAFEAASKVIPFRPPLSRGTVNFFTETRAFSTSRARRELDYRPCVPLVDGVRRTVAWYREQGLL